MEFNKIYNEDCAIGLKQLDDCSIDLTVTSPPYDNLRTYNGFSFDFETIAKELYRVTKQGGVVVWIVADQTIEGNESGTSFRQALFFKETGFNLNDTMIWSKPCFTAVGALTARYAQTFEYMFVFTKGKICTVNLIRDRKNKWAGHVHTGTTRERNGETRSASTRGKILADYGPRFNVWEMSSCRQSECNGDHPAPFPEQLALDHITSWSNEGDIVLDPFMGSGTTAKAALLLRRKFIGFEISKEYCDMANKRISFWLNQTSIFDFTESNAP